MDLNFVTERIAIGGWSSVLEIQSLRSYNITGILNVAMNLDICRGAGGSIYKTALPFDYAKIGLHDGTGNTKAAMMAAELMMEEMLNRHKKILVNCWSGLSRSTSVVCYYMVKNEISENFDKALETIRLKRENAKPHEALKKLVLECLSSTKG